MHKNILLSVGITILIICIGLCGCNENLSKKNNTNKFIGGWERISYYLNYTMNVTLTFYNDSTAKQVSDDAHTHWFNYKVENNFLYLALQEFPEIDAICYYYEFSNNETALTLTNEDLDTLILTKQLV